jgi:hypothetical protein
MDHHLQKLWESETIRDNKARNQIHTSNTHSVLPTYTPLGRIDNQVIVVGNPHGIHSRSKQFCGRHHVRKSLGVQLVFTGDIVNVEIVSSWNARSLFELLSSISILQKPRSVHELNSGFSVDFDTVFHWKQSLALQQTVDRFGLFVGRRRGHLQSERSQAGTRTEMVTTKPSSSGGSGQQNRHEYTIVVECTAKPR